MYTVLKILGKPIASGGYYRPVDINESIENLLNLYTECVMELSHSAIPEHVGLLLSDVITMLLSSDRTMSMNQWIATIGSTALPTKESPYDIKRELVKQSCIISTNMRISFVNKTGQWTEGMTDDMLTDVSLLRSDLDYLEVYNHCLFSINGLLHIADASTEGIFIHDAATSIKLEDKIQLSTLSFYGIGQIETLPIDTTMIDRGIYNRYRDGFNLNIPRDLSKKTVMLSIAGHLHYNNDCYHVTGDNSVFIDWSRIPISERYFDGRYKIDWSAFMSVAEQTGMVDDLMLDELARGDDEAILAILRMSQTFVILVDSTDLFYEHRYLEKTALPGRYLSNVAPVGPIRTTEGYLNPYKVTKIAKWFWISMGLNWTKHRVVEKTNYRSSGIYRDGRVSQDPKYLSNGRELLIGKEIVS